MIGICHTKAVLDLGLVEGEFETIMGVKSVEKGMGKNFKNELVCLEFDKAFPSGMLLQAFSGGSNLRKRIPEILQIPVVKAKFFF